MLLGALGAAVALLPFWFPPALKPALRHFGVQAGGVHRAGYAALRLRELQHRVGNVDIQAREVRLPQPTAWLWHRWLGSADATNALIVVTDWRVAVLSAETNTAPAVEPSASPGAVLDDLNRVAAVLNRWLPHTEARAGRVAVAGRELLVPMLRWRAGGLELDAALAEPACTAQIALEARAANRFTLELRAPARQFALQLDLRAQPSAWVLAGNGAWRDNAVELRAQIGRETAGPWPDRLELHAPQINLPASALGLPGYANLLGQAWLTGERDRFELRASARAEPLRADLPPVRVDARVRASPDALTVERLDCRSAPLELTLSNPVTWRRATRQIDQPARLTVKTDLSAQPGRDLRGRLEGELTLTPGAGLEPLTEFHLAGADLEGHGLAVDHLEISGRTAGLRIERLDGAARWDNGSALTVTARGVDLRGRTLADATVGATLRPGLPLVQSWPLSFESANVRALLSGAWTNLRHHGTFAVTQLAQTELKPFHLAGSWDGAHAARITAQVEAATADGGAALAGTLENLREFTLASLRIWAGDEPPLVLREPARMRFRAAPSTGGPAWSFETSRLTLTNAQSHLGGEGALAWPESVRARLAATNLDSHLPGAFMRRPLPNATLESLVAELDGAQGPARFRLAASGRLEAATNWSVRAAASLEGDERGLRVAELRLFECDAEALRLSGRVPILCGLLGPGRFWDLRPDQPLALDFHLASTPALQRIGLGRLGLLAANLHGHGTLAGTPAAPSGQVRVLADGVEPLEDSPLAVRLPRLNALELNLRADTRVVRLEPLRLRVEGTPLELAAELPLTAGFWEGVTGGTVRPDLHGLSARLRLDPLPLADLTARLPPVLRPEGQLSADLRLAPGWRWAGHVDITGLATRPLPGVGPLRNVRGRLVLQDREARLEACSVDVGGETARLEGHVALPAGPPATWQLPAFDVRLTGREIPLVRDAELLVRGDLDLHLEHAAPHAPLLAGTVTLGRSFVLSDLQAVIGAGVRRAARPPPFFSVEAEPFARWRLGVDLRGDECLHVRSPFYTGVHSVNVKLRGTLREPLLLGDAQVVRANVVFPYAVLPVRQGIVSFSEEDPARPRLQAQAGGRAFGYDLRLETTGTLDAPVIRFSSSPPLNSEDILLMVSAGELPRHSMDPTTADRLAKFAFILGQDLMRKLGAAEPGEERLTFRTGERISARGKVTRHIELRLTDAWSLVGEYDEYDELNAGVKWRVLRR